MSFACQESPVSVWLIVLIIGQWDCSVEIQATLVCFWTSRIARPNAELASIQLLLIALVSKQFFALVENNY